MADKALSLNNAAGTLTLEFLPRLGGSITAFYAKEEGRRIDLMRAAPQQGDFDVLQVGSFPLTPFSNRIGGGQYVLDGKTYSVGPNFRDEPHPNHGDGWTSEWTLDSQKAHEATLSLESGLKALTPYVYRAEQTFSLSDDALTISMSIENKGQETLPFGLGHHPYFRRTPDVRFKANLTHIWNSRMMLPTDVVAVPDKWDFSQGKLLDRPDIGEPTNGFDGTAFLDHCFQGWDNKAEIIWPSDKAKLTMTSDPLFSHFVLFVPQDDFFCAEPVSHATDAFNLHQRGEKNVGFKTLAPGEKMSGAMRFAYSQLTTR